MELFLSLWFSLVILALVTWVGRLALLGFIARILPPLRPDMYVDGDDEDLPTVSFLVSAKDEAANIEACLRSLCEQDYPRLEVIAINDRSRDDTGLIMDRLAAKEARLSVCHVSELREGWFGKNNAMREGVARSTGQWLCFTDADCAQVSRRSLGIAMRYALAKGADFLSVLPSHEANSFWERVVQPACSGILMLWFSPLAVNNPKRRAAYANGAFMLMRRSCYQAIGGHEAVKTEVNEDIHMARRVKQIGYRLLVASNRGLYTVRMYGTFREIWSGWTRIFSGCFGSVRRLLLVALVLIEFSLLPWATLVAAALVEATGGADSATWQWPWLKWSALAACAVQLGVMVVFYALSRAPFVYGLLYPLGAAFGLGALVNAMKCAGGWGSITWRGTTYRDGIVQADTGAAWPLSSDSGDLPPPSSQQRWNEALGTQSGSVKPD